MKYLLLTMPMMLIAGCATGPSDSAICDATAKLRTDHAAALVADGGPRSKVTGARLIGIVDAGCRKGAT